MRCALCGKSIEDQEWVMYENGVAHRECWETKRGERDKCLDVLTDAVLAYLTKEKVDLGPFLDKTEVPPFLEEFVETVIEVVSEELWEEVKVMARRKLQDELSKNVWEVLGL